MIKKKLNILLLLSLVLLFISLLGTTSFAREISTNEICNMIRNFYANTTPIADNRVPVEELIQYHLDQGHIQRIAQVTSDLPTQFVIGISYEQLWIWYTWAGSTTGSNNNYKPYIWNSQLNSNTSYMGNAQFRIKFTDKTFWYNANNQSSPSFYNNNNTVVYYYSAYNIWNSSPYNQILIPAGTYYPNEFIFDSPSSFTIDINADFRNNKATISNDTSGTQYYLIPYTSDKVRIGNMFDYSNLAAVIKRKFRYKQTTRSFDLIQEYQANTNNLEFFDIADDTLIVFEYCHPDTTEFITFVPKADTGFSQFTVPIYFTSSNTSIVNGVIDTGDTFSGDNYNNYNNDTNTDKIIDNINNDNEVDSTLNEFISGDAEDIANKFGFRLFNQEYYDFIYNTIVSITNVLTDDSDVYFDYSMHGEAPTRIYASSFTTPNGTLKTFLTMFLVSCTVFAFYKYIADLLELISTGNILEALDEFKVDRNIFKM